MDRTSSNNVVDQTIGYFRTRDRIIPALSPEGTRRKIPQWRTGFYWVAVGAGVPIVPVAFDFPRRRIVLNPPQLMSGEMEKDLAQLRGFFNAAQAYRPGTTRRVRIPSRIPAFEFRFRHPNSDSTIIL